MRFGMMVIVGAGLWAGGLLLAGEQAFSAEAPPASDDLATGAGYGSSNLTFEIWCHEIQKYPAQRCATPSEADLSDYNDTKLRLQAIEVEHDKDQRQERQFRKNMELHDDPYRPPDRND